MQIFWSGMLHLTQCHQRINSKFLIFILLFRLLLDREIAVPTKHALTDSVTTSQKFTPEAARSTFRKKKRQKQ